jgi:hypothetical protein
MTRNDTTSRQVGLSVFEDGGRVLADGGVTLMTGEQLAESDPDYEQPYTEGSSAYERLTADDKYGIMFAGDYEWSNAHCTAEAYNGGCAAPGSEARIVQSRQFHTDWMDDKTAKECVREIGSYNGFSAGYVTAAIDGMPDSARFVVGREDSPSLYIWTDRADEVVDELEQSNPFAAKAPDELDAYPNAEQYPQPQGNADGPEPGQPVLVRAWWD